MIEVLEATYQEEYKIWLNFSSGESGIADLEDLLCKFKAAWIEATEAYYQYVEEWGIKVIFQDLTPRIEKTNHRLCGIGTGLFYEMMCDH